MVTTGELLAMATLRPSDGPPDAPTVALSGESADETVVALMAFFGEDDGRDGVCLAMHGVGSGYLRRTQLYSFYTSLQKGGYGASDSWSTPGQSSYTFLTVRCPVDGAEFLVTRLDEKRPPKCPIHGDAMDPVE